MVLEKTDSPPLSTYSGVPRPPHVQAWLVGLTWRLWWMGASAVPAKDLAANVLYQAFVLAMVGR